MSETNERLARIEEVLKHQGGDIDKLAQAVEKLAGALINKEVFNELQNDVHQTREEVRKLQGEVKALNVKVAMQEKRIDKLETKAETNEKKVDGIITKERIAAALLAIIGAVMIQSYLRLFLP